MRDGEQQRVPTRVLVPGDLLVLGEGDTVAADARLPSAATLKISEAPLTGESEPFLNEAFTTAPLSPEQWVVCVAMASTVLWAGEIRKLTLDLSGSRRHAARPRVQAGPS